MPTYLEIILFPYVFFVQALCLLCQDPRMARAYTTAQNTKICALLACLAQPMYPIPARCGTDTAGRGAFEPPPEDVFHSFKPCIRQAKQTNAQSLQTSSKTNAREYATTKFKTAFGNDANFVNHPGAANIEIQPNLRNSSSTCVFFSTSRSSRSASVRVHVDVQNGIGRAMGVGAALPSRRSTKLLDREFQFRESHIYWGRDDKNSRPNP